MARRILQRLQWLCINAAYYLDDRWFRHRLPVLCEWVWESDWWHEWGVLLDKGQFN